MKKEILGNQRLLNFVDAGSTKLNNFIFASNELDKNKTNFLASPPGIDDDSEMKVQFRLNQTGNIFYSTTSPTLQEETKKLFESVTVLFAAMTKALADKGKTLFDFAAWSGIIRKSGYFVEVQKFQKMLTIQRNSIAINTQIVQQLLPGLVTGSSMDIAKGVLQAVNGEYKSERTDETTKLGHLLFICEELFGAPSVTVRLFFATKQSHISITSSPCHKSSSTSFEQLQEADTFLFVSPDTIAEFAYKFGESPEEYKNLISRLSGFIE